MTKSALDAFISSKVEIDELLANLAGQGADHFGVHPDEISWGHVGSLNYIAGLLREATRFLGAQNV